MTGWALPGSDPTPYSILTLLAEREATVSEVAARFRTVSRRICGRTRGRRDTMNEQTPPAADQHLLIPRMLDAPRERVFHAWTDPDALAACYGPDHVDVPRERIVEDPDDAARRSSPHPAGGAAPKRGGRRRSARSPSCSPDTDRDRARLLGSAAFAGVRRCPLWARCSHRRRGRRPAR